MFLIPILLSSLLAAQPAGYPHRQMPNLKDGPLAARLYHLRLTRIQQTLGLTEDQARAITERWKRYDIEFMNSAQRLEPIQCKFNEVLRGPGTEEEKNTQLRPMLEQFLAQRSQQDQARRRFEEDMRANLSTAQQVRLILLMEDLHRELKDILRQAMREHRHGRGN